ncbi:unnamed protein product [Calypogeia fissa]
MEVPMLGITAWCTISMLSFIILFPSAVVSDPIKVDFSHCRNSTYITTVTPNGPTESIQCCPPLPTRPIIDGPPPPSTKSIRVRKASQCTDAAYAAKLEKAYALMRALPDDDPRSFTQQWYLHCSYCGGAFLTTNSSGVPEGIDIHWSWLFFPWHRWYLYFHERILQSLLEDPTFSLNYWNWDSPYTVGGQSSKSHDDHEACLKEGADFPFIYSDSSSAVYDVNRSENAKGNGRLHFPDISYRPLVAAAQQPLYNASAEDIIGSNLNILYKALVSSGTTTETFMGRPYRAGNLPGSGAPNGGAGTLEVGAHSGVHSWTGRDPPSNDMGLLSRSARDPVFYAHHSNVDRLWQVWKDIGPILGQKHEDYTDPDFLNAEFLFYDENKDLRRVTVADSLDSKKLGYVYQDANDAPWIFYNSTKCSQLSYHELLAQAQSLPSPLKDSKGYYSLEGGETFTVVVDRPENPQNLEEFLTIDGINLDRTWSTGFDVFVDWLNPTEYTAPSKCAEYNGRFTNLAQSPAATQGKRDLVWKQSVTRTLVDIGASTASSSRIVITIVPLFHHGSGSDETIRFKDIKVDTS